MSKEKLKEWWKKVSLRREDIKALVVSVVITAFFFGGFFWIGPHFTEAMWIISMILLAIILAIIAGFAEFAVIKSLFLIAAEISLLIFLGQSYCEIPQHAAVNDAAMKNLFTLSLLYIGILFSRALYRQIRGYYKRMEDKRWSWEKVVTVALFLIFTGMFLYEVYLAVSPIVMNLCLYK